MKNRLFRLEAIEAKREQLLGEVVLVQPFSFSVLTFAILAIAAIMVAFVVWGEYTRKSRVPGFLSPDKGLVKVYTPQSGIIDEQHVSPGQHVAKGDPLFVVSLERGSRTTPRLQSSAIVKLHERRDSLRQSLVQQNHIDELSLQSLQVRIRGLRQEIVQLNSEISTQQQRVASAASIAERYQALLTNHFVSGLDVTQKQEEWLERQGRLQAIKRNRTTLTKELNVLRFKLHSMKLNARNARAEIEREISAIEQQITEYEVRRDFIISAPTNGVVTTILTQPGQLANSDAPLLSIVPDDAILEAHLLVPSRSIGFIGEGQAVSLRYQTFPYQRFGTYKGHVIEISQTVIMPGEADLPTILEEPSYRVTVELERQTVNAYKKSLPLQSGMLLDADVLLDRRPLYQWIFDPLYALVGKV